MSQEICKQFLGDILKDGKPGYKSLISLLGGNSEATLAALYRTKSMYKYAKVVRLQGSHRGSRNKYGKEEAREKAYEDGFI